MISVTFPCRIVKIVPIASGIGPAWRLQSRLVQVT
jgi:hypothetical protein